MRFPRPGDSAGSRRHLLVVIIWAFGALALLGALGGCSSPATSAVEADPDEESDADTGSNEAFEATEEEAEAAAAARAAAEAAAQAEDAAAEEAQVGFPAPPDGYLVWAHPVQPVGLAVADQVNGGLNTTSWIREGLWESLYRVNADRGYEPELLAEDAVVTDNDNGTVSIAYRLRSGLQWSDGEPLTSEDVAYTHDILMEGCLKEADGSAIDVSNEGCEYPLRDRTGYDLVTGFDVVDNTRFTVTMAAFYPDWRALYPHIFAAHAFGETAVEVATNLDGLASGGELPSSGPLVLAEWGDRWITLAVNDGYHGSSTGGEGSGVAGVQINFVGSASDAVEAVSSGEADIALVGPSVDLISDPPDGVMVTAQPALEYEHLGLNLLNPNLSDPAVRQAVISAIGRDDVANAFGGLVGNGVTAAGVGNAFWLPGQSGYQDHQPGAATADPTAAEGQLVAAGYTRGSDGVFSHPDRGRLSLRLLTNSGDTIRLAMQQTLVEQLTEAGFDVDAVSRPGGAYLTEGPFASSALEAAHSGGAQGDPDRWDMVIFAWAGGPWPGLQSGAFRSKSGANPYGYSNPKFDTESSRCDGLVDDAERATCYQDLDLYITGLEKTEDGIVVIPLAERPQLVVMNGERLESAPSVLDGPSGGPLAAIAGFKLR